MISSIIWDLYPFKETSYIVPTPLFILNFFRSQFVFSTMSINFDQPSTQIEVEDEPIPSPNINTPPSTPLHTPVKSFFSNLSFCVYTYWGWITRCTAWPEPCRSFPFVTEEQGSTSPLGHTFSSLSENILRGDLVEDKGVESNILIEGPE